MDELGFKMINYFLNLINITLNNTIYFFFSACLLKTSSVKEWTFKINHTNISISIKTSSKNTLIPLSGFKKTVSLHSTLNKLIHSQLFSAPPLFNASINVL